MGMLLHLKVKKGQYEGRLITLDRFPATFGRSKKCDHPCVELGMGQIHFSIDVQNAGFSIVALDTIHGTYLNGKRLKGLMMLHDQDTVKAGKLVLQVTGEAAWEDAETYLPLDQKFQPDSSATPDISKTAARQAEKENANDGNMSDAKAALPTASTPNAEKENANDGNAADAEVTPPDGDMVVRRHIDIEETSVLFPAQEKMQHSYLALKTIYDVLKQCNSEPNHEFLLERLLRSIFKAVHADRGAIVRKSNQDKSYYGKVFIKNGQKCQEFAISQTILKDIMENGVSLISYDLKQDERYRFSESLRIQTVRSFIGAPLISYEKIFGAVYLDRLQLRSQPFTSEDLELLAAIGIQVGSTLEKSFLLQEVQQSLEEKELLLKEIYHRVKNNLQIISSLLNLQSRRIKDTQILAVFQESCQRIQSIALVHDKLCHAKNLAKVDFAVYIHSLVNSLCHSYAVGNNAPQVKIYVDNVFLGVDTAILCGLIINELVSNIFKYAFPAREGGEIIIALQPLANQQVNLIVQDNGIGLPLDIDFHNTDSLGLKLVRNLIEQLAGTVEIFRDHGTIFKILFPLS